MCIIVCVYVRARACDTCTGCRQSRTTMAAIYIYIYILYVCLCECVSVSVSVSVSVCARARASESCRVTSVVYKYLNVHVVSL